MIDFLVFTAFIILIIGFMTINKIYFYRQRSSAEKLFAEVVEYRSERGPMRNDATKLDYPYVRIVNEKDSKLIKLKYASSSRRPFKIGDRVEVFWNGDTLMYWNAFDSGLSKFLPVQWNIFDKMKA